MSEEAIESGPVSVADHYERLLAEHYTWMSGVFDERVADQRALFEDLGLAPAGSGRALDLGCGSGFQSVALAELGFAVTAVDTSAKLLRELKARKGTLPIATIEADMESVSAAVAPGFDVAVCMGDSLPIFPRPMPSPDSSPTWRG